MFAILAALVLALLSALSSLRPGVEVDVLASPTPSSLPADSTTWFVAGLCDLGRTDQAILVTSITDFVAKCGARVSYSVLYDALDTFFAEGGFQAYVGRVVGPGATKGFHNVLDGSSAVSLIVTALGAGASSSNISVKMIAGSQPSTYQIQVLYNGTVVEQSPDLFSQADAVTWASANSSYVSIAVGGGTVIPAVGGAAVVLSAGSDDRANITDAQWLAAINLFGSELGPGQISAPGSTTDARHLQLLNAADAQNRVAILDGADTPTSASLITEAVNANGASQGQYGGLFAPWVVVPGVIQGTTRTVPPSALVAGCIARSDPANGPGTPAAGDNGQAQFAVGVSQPAWDDTTRDALNTAGVNAIRVVNGVVKVYGWRTMANPNITPGWVTLGAARYLQNLAFRCWKVGQGFVFKPLDSQGHTIANYASAITALCLSDWNAGEIYGQSPSDAFIVDVGSAVNTAQSLAQNQLIADVAVRPSPMAELVKIRIVNVPITQAV